MKSYASSLFARNLLLVFVPLAFLLVMGGASTVVTQDAIVRQTNASLVATLEQVQATLELMLNELDSVNLTFSTDPEFINALASVVETPGLTLESWARLRSIHNFISSAVNTRPYLHSLYVYIPNPYHRVLNTLDMMTSLEEFYDKGWYDRFLAEDPETLLWTARTSVRPYKGWDHEEPVIQISRRTFVQGSERNRGVIVLNVNVPVFERLLARFAPPQTQSLLVINDRGDLMVSNGRIGAAQKELASRVGGGATGLTEARLDNERYVVAHLFSPRYRWSYVALAPRARLYAASYRLRTINLLLVGLSFAAGLLLTYALSRRSFGSIRQIVDTVEAAERGDPLPAVTGQPQDGYGTIAVNILKTFIEHSYLKVQQKVLELQALQAQLNPHFLFNTLETISFKALQLSGKPGPLNRMIENLSDILKYALEDPGTPVTLSDEIEHARAYLDIQSVRYPRKFRVTWECEESAGDTPVIRMMLQPLIENAIYHGIREKKGQGTIAIVARRSDEELEVAVRDDGVGMSAERLAEVRARLEQAPRSAGHIGLPNTAKRLVLAYGERARITLASASPGGTEVTLRIPLSPPEAAVRASPGIPAASGQSTT
jgi:two-component system, sensor histidine kinase YesM